MLRDPTRLPADWIWYRHEDAEDEVPPASSPNAVAATPRSRPRIYATLGSMAGGNDFGRPVFAGMLSALGRLDADVLFTIGPFDPAAIGQPPANVTVSAYEPQSQAMRCDAAVIHAGSGTTVAALARGLPLVAVPLFADQMHNADRLVAAQLAVRVDPGESASGSPRPSKPSSRPRVRDQRPARGRGHRSPTDTGPGPRPAAHGCDQVEEEQCGGGCTT